MRSEFTFRLEDFIRASKNSNNFREMVSGILANGGLRKTQKIRTHIKSGRFFSLVDVASLILMARDDDSTLKRPNITSYVVFSSAFNRTSSRACNRLSSRAFNRLSWSASAANIIIPPTEIPASAQCGYMFNFFPTNRCLFADVKTRVGRRYNKINVRWLDGRHTELLTPRKLSRKWGRHDFISVNNVLYLPPYHLTFV